MIGIGVVADTHYQGPAALRGPVRARLLHKSQEFYPAFLEAARRLFEGAAAILHAGDIVCPEVLDDLSAIAPVEAVRGNMDPRPLSMKLEETRVVEAGGRRIGLTHGRGSPWGIEKRVLKALEGEAALDAVVYGHSHRPACRVSQRAGRPILLLNPGSPTDRLFAPFRSVGLIEIDEDDPSSPVRGRIIRLGF